MSGGGLQGLRLVAGAWHSSADRAAEADGKAEPRADVLLPLSLLPHAGAFPAEVPLRLSAGLARQSAARECLRVRRFAHMCADRQREESRASLTDCGTAGPMKDRSIDRSMRIDRQR